MRYKSILEDQTHDLRQLAVDSVQVKQIFEDGVAMMKRNFQIGDPDSTPTKPQRDHGIPCLYLNGKEVQINLGLITTCQTARELFP